MKVKKKSMDKTLVGMKKSTRAVMRRCSVHNNFWKMCKIRKKIPVLESAFNEVSGLKTCIFIQM